MAQQQHGQPPVEFTLDGVPHTSEIRRMSAGQILRQFGGLDPATYDLIRIEGPHEDRYPDSQEIEIVPHGKYISLFTGPMPVE